MTTYLGSKYIRNGDDENMPNLHNGNLPFAHGSSVAVALSSSSISSERITGGYQATCLRHSAQIPPIELISN